MDQLQPITAYQAFMPPFLPNGGFGCYNFPKYNMLGSPARKLKSVKGKVCGDCVLGLVWVKLGVGYTNALM